jgi:hypothetical protein
VRSVGLVSNRPPAVPRWSLYLRPAKPPPSRGNGGSSSPASRGLASSSSTRFTERTSGFLPKQARTMLAISLRLNGGYSALRSTMNRLTFGGILCLRAFSVESKPLYPCETAKYET